MSLASRSSYGDESDLVDLDDEALNRELIDCLKNAAVRILLTLMEFLEHGMIIWNIIIFTLKIIFLIYMFLILSYDVWQCICLSY